MQENFRAEVDTLARPKRAISSRSRALRGTIPRSRARRCSACVRARNLHVGNGKQRENRPKSAKIGESTGGRKRPRWWGQNRAGCVATAVSTGNATIGRNAKNAKLGALKSKSPHSTWTSEHSYTCSLFASEPRTSRRSGMSMSAGCNAAEKHERSLTLFAGLRGPACARGPCGAVVRPTIASPAEAPRCAPPYLPATVIQYASPEFFRICDVVRVTPARRFPIEC